VHNRSYQTADPLAQARKARRHSATARGSNMAESPKHQHNLWHDETVARELFDRYAEKLTALARKRISQRLASRIDPEDIVQSAFRTFFHRAREGQFQLKDPDDLCKLLARITVHKTLRQVAFHKRAKRNACQETGQGED